MSSMRRLDQNSRGISYLVSGPANSEITLVCIHGSACQATDFAYFIPQLSKDEDPFQVIAIDLPGSGKSSAALYPEPNMAVFADVILNLINDLRIENIVLAGHSMGVRVVLEAWRQSQRREKPNVKGLVFLDGSHYAFRTSLFAFDPKNAHSKTLSAQEKSAAKADAYKRMFSKQTPMEFRAETLAHVEAMDDDYYNVVRQSFIDYDHKHMDEALEQLGASGLPLLNVQATDIDSNDQRHSLKTADTTRWTQVVQEKAPQAQLFIVEDSGHFPHVDQPLVSANRIREFVGGFRS